MRGVSTLVILGVLSLGSLIALPQTALAACVSPPSGLVVWWPGDGNANDIAGANSGVLQNGATFAPGQVGQAFSLDGFDDFIEVPNSASLGITDEITIDAWVKIASPGGQFFPQHYVIDSRDGIGGGYGLNVDTELIQFWIGDFFPNYPSTVQVGQWHHVAGTYDGSNMVVYVDGVVMGSFSPTTNLIPSTAPLFIGQRFTFTERFDGLIDEVEIYGRALAASEIQAIFNAGSDGKCKPDGDGDNDGDNTLLIAGIIGAVIAAAAAVAVAAAIVKRRRRRPPLPPPLQ